MIKRFLWMGLVLGLSMAFMAPAFSERLYGEVSSNMPYAAASAPSKLQDNLDTTAFCADTTKTESGTVTLTVDYGKAYVVSDISFLMSGADGLQSMKLEYTEDGMVWNTVKTGAFLSQEKIENLHIPVRALKLSFYVPNSTVEVYEMNVQTSFLTEVAHRKPVLAESSYEMKRDGWSMEDLTDGSFAFGFSTNPYEKNTDPEKPYAITIDLEENTALGQIVLFTKQGKLDTFPINMEILVSQDNVTYTRAGVATDIETISIENGYGICLGGAMGRYVRIQNGKLRATSGNDGYLMQFSEAHVFRADAANQGTIRVANEKFSINEGKTRMLVPYYSYPDENVSYTFTAENPDIVAVDPDGLVRAVSPGTACVYITDNIRHTQKTVTVTVKKREFDFMAFYPPTVSYDTVEQYAYMKEAGFTSALFAGWDWVTTPFMQSSIRAANANGIKFYVGENRSAQFPNLSDAEVRHYVNEYQSMPGVMGYYVKDEPYPDSTPYAATYKAIVDEDPDAIPHMNHLPFASFLFTHDSHDGYVKYVDDWVAILGTKYKNKISFDQYPFWGDDYVEKDAMYHFEVFHRLARKHDIDFEYYIQSIQIENGAKATPKTVPFHLALGMAYGVKSFQYFTYFSTGDGDTAVMTNTGKKGYLYEATKEANARAKKVQSYLAPAEALHVYHHGTLVENESPVPENFFFRIEGSQNAVVSHFRNEAKREDYVFVVNKDFAGSGNTYTFIVDEATEVYDVTDGSKQKITMTDGKFSQTIPGGHFKLYVFNDGFTFELPETGEKNPNVAADKPVYISSSGGAMFLTDERDDTGWTPASGDAAPWALIDLKEDTEISSVILKFADHVPHVTISVSRDDVYYEALKTEMKQTSEGYMFAFSPRRVRYIRVELSDASVTLKEVCAYDKDLFRVLYSTEYLNNGLLSMTFAGGDYTDMVGVCALYEDGRVVAVRTLHEEDLSVGNTVELFTVRNAHISYVKTFFWKSGLTYMSPTRDTLDCSPGKATYITETFDNGYNEEEWSLTVIGESTQTGVLTGFAYAFSLQKPIYMPGGYTFSMDLKAPADPVDTNHWMSAVVCLRSNKDAAPYLKTNGIMLLIRGNELGVRTKQEWSEMFSEGQTFLILPVSFDAQRKLIIRDNVDEILISTMENEKELMLAKLIVTDTGATLYDAEGVTGYGTVPVSLFGGQYLGVANHLKQVTFDNLELSCKR